MNLYCDAGERVGRRRESESEGDACRRFGQISGVANFLPFQTFLGDSGCESREMKRGGIRFHAGNPFRQKVGEIRLPRQSANGM